MIKPALQTRQSGGAQTNELQPELWRMEIPSGPSGVYRLAQVDDYMALPRARFPWRAPVALDLRARISSADLPGTWGFGFWNDPFNVGLGVGGSARRLPALPNTAWFFYAGIPNYLALQDGHPAQGFLAATFASPRLPALALAPAGLALPLLALPPAARLLRKAAGLLIGEDSQLITIDPAQWHAYRLEWQANRVRFFVDGEEIFSTSISPQGSLGLVIWIDNQYAAFPPSGKLRSGTSPNPEQAWLEVDQVQLLRDAVQTS